MNYFNTNFSQHQINVDLEHTRIYERQLDDNYERLIIEPNREDLEGVLLNRIYALISNEGEEVIEEAYCSIAFNVIDRGDCSIYSPAIVTCENIANKENCLRYFIRQVLTLIANENPSARLQTEGSIGLIPEGDHIAVGTDFLLSQVPHTDVQNENE